MRKKVFPEGLLFLLFLWFIGCVQGPGEDSESEVWIPVTAYDELSGLWRAVNRVTLDTGKGWGLPPAELSLEYTQELIYPAGEEGREIESRIIIDFEPYADFRTEVYINFLFPQGLPAEINKDMFKESLWQGVVEQEIRDGSGFFEGYKRIQRSFAPVPRDGFYKNEDGEKPLLINTRRTGLKQTRPLRIAIDGETLFTGDAEFLFSFAAP
jgi:hypothetical protein